DLIPVLVKDLTKSAHPASGAEDKDFFGCLDHGVFRSHLTFQDLAPPMVGVLPAQIKSGEGSRGMKRTVYRTIPVRIVGRI
ncbi:MAG: hypothetical protein KC978_13140, partial [Candidatus Omnitrophica bacterium]|nr:hypothetical protein [Candidatus Omnitrophota bacterium]